MELREEFLTIAELAVAIAGFSAVVTAFMTRGRLNTNDVARFRTLILSSGPAAVLAFVPSLVFSMGYSGTVLWRIASCIMIATAIAAWAATMFQRHDQDIPRVALLPIASLGILNLVLQGANATGIAWAPGGAAYLAGALLWLSASLATFVSIVIYRPEDDDQPGPPAA